MTLLGQRWQADPCRCWKRSGQDSNGGPSARQQRHKRRGKAFARKRHERADYHPTRSADGRVWDGSRRPPTLHRVIAYNPCVLARPRAWLHRATARLDQVAFSPASLPDDLVTGIALAPPVAAGIIIFKVPALEMLGVALAVGIGGQLIARWVWRRDIPRPKPGAVIAAVFGVALVGAGAPLTT